MKYYYLAFAVLALSAVGCAGAGTLARVNLAQPVRSDHLWKQASHEVYISTENLRAKDREELLAGLTYRKLIRGNPGDKVVALTFDDGPHPIWTERLLAILRREHVRGTFFVVGKMVEKHPELLRDIVADGNEVGNHTFSHATLTRLTAADILTEYQACNDIIWSVGHVRPTVCRPPGGDYDSRVIDAASDLGMTTTLWTDDPGDFDRPGESEIVDRTLHSVSNGGILLLHDGVTQTLDVLPLLIHELRDRGYRFVTASEMLQTLQKPGAEKAARLVRLAAPKPSKMVRHPA